MQVDMNKLKNKLQQDKAEEVLVFRPSRAQQIARANFWTYFSQEGSAPPSIIDLATALRFGLDMGISEWWSIPGFREWFSNQDEFRQRLEFLANLSLDKLENLINSEASNANAKVAAIKLIMELSKKLQHRNTADQYLDEKVGQMDKKQLEEYIKAHTKLVTPDNSDTNSLTPTQKSDNVE